MNLQQTRTAEENGAATSGVGTSDWDRLDRILYVWVPATVIVFLLGVVPYATGYGFVRLSLAHIMEYLWRSPDWEHCAFVPLAIAFIVYELRDRLRGLSVQPSWLGWPALVVGLGFYWIGERVDNHYIGFAAIQILVAAWILLGFGWKYFLTLLFPWLFLIFLWPLIFLETYLAFPLRLVMSEASVWVLNWLGIDAMKVGTAIVSAPDAVAGIKAGERFSVDVANPCSGIRSLFALMMVSALYGFLTFRQWWKHLLIFLTSIPLAILGNLFRILLLTVGTLVFGTEFAIGRGIEEPSAYHMFAGFFVFAVAIGGMLVIGWALNFSWQEFFVGLLHMRRIPAPAQIEEGSLAGTALEDAKPIQSQKEPSKDLY